MTDADLLSVAERLVRAHGLEFVPQIARAHLDAGRAAAPDSTPMNLLARVCEGVGMRALFVDRTAREVAAQAGALVPLAAVTHSGQLVLVLEGRGTRVRVATSVTPGGDDSTWIDMRELAARLEAGDADAPVRWLSVDPALPCDPLGTGLARKTDEADTTHAEPAHGHHASGHHASPLSRLLVLLRLERRDIGVLVVYAVVVSILGLATPLAVQALVTNVSFGALTQPIIVLALVVVFALAFAGALRALQLVVIESIQQRMFLSLVADLAARLPRVRGDALMRLDTSKLVNRFFDVVTAQKAAATLLLDGLALALELSVGLTLLAVYNPLLLGFSASLMGLLAFVVFFLGRGAVRTSIEESWAKHAIADWFEEVTRNVTLFRRAAARDVGVARADTLARAYLKARRGHFAILLRQNIGLFILQAIAAASLLGVGGALVVRGQLTLGQLVAAELIVAVVIAGIGKLGKQLETVYDLLAALDKIGHLVDLPVERSDGEDAVQTHGPSSLVVHALSAAAADIPLLHDVSLRIDAGESVALLGGGGAGKSALVDAIDGALTPDSGHILLDGVDTRTLSPVALRQRVGVVRDAEVFEGTVAENLRAGNQQARSHALMEALQLVELEGEVLALPQGLLSMLKHGGAPLSSSQALRLTLARMVVARPGLLLIDGALDSLEPDLRTRIVERLRAAPWCSLLVTSHAEDVVAGLARSVSIHHGRVSDTRFSGGER